MEVRGQGGGQRSGRRSAVREAIRGQGGGQAVESSRVEEVSSDLSGVDLLAAPLAEVGHAARLELRVQPHVQRSLTEDPLHLHLTVPGELRRGRRSGGRGWGGVWYEERGARGGVWYEERGARGGFSMRREEHREGFSMRREEQVKLKFKTVKTG